MSGINSNVYWKITSYFPALYWRINIIPVVKYVIVLYLLDVHRTLYLHVQLSYDALPASQVIVVMCTLYIGTQYALNTPVQTLVCGGRHSGCHTKLTSEVLVRSIERNVESL